MILKWLLNTLENLENNKLRTRRSPLLYIGWGKFVISDIDKQVALEMAKSIIIARNDNSKGNLEYRHRINEVSYWVETYHKCLREIALKSK